MAEVLSQSEIDALLSALSSGELTAEEIRKEEPQHKVKTYDFKRAMRFSKDQIRSLSRIFENFSRLLTTYFSANLRTYVQIQVISVEQLPYEEFIRSIPKVTILNIFGVYPLDGKFVMEVNPNIAYAMLDRLLGGQGAGQGAGQEAGQEVVRSLTEIETKVMMRMFGRALEYFGEAWKGVAVLEPEMDLMEVNPQFIQLVSPNETVAVVSLSSKIGETSGMINVCMPHVVLEPIMPKLSAHYWMNIKKPRENSNDLQAIQQSLQRAALPITVELGSSTITIEEFLQLTVGDVIKLDQEINQNLSIKVGNAHKYLGQPGVSRGRIAVQITKVQEEGVKEDD